jgi:phosphatidylethanolamine-binding protein (PEBP) family uncharacterized protein
MVCSVTVLSPALWSIHDQTPLPRLGLVDLDTGEINQPLARPFRGSAAQGPNSLGERSYCGPNAPNGHGIHHYYFGVYALATEVHGELTREVFLDA